MLSNIHQPAFQQTPAYYNTYLATVENKVLHDVHIVLYLTVPKYQDPKQNELYEID